MTNDLKYRAEAMLEETQKQKIARFKQEDKAIQNSAIAQITLTIATLDKIDLDNANEVYQRALKYFNICIENGIKPTQEGMASALKISPFTLRNWLQGGGNKTKEVREVLNWIQSTLQMMTIQNMIDGNLNPISGIFISKNNFGYTNDEKVIVEKVQEEKPDIDAILSKYKSEE